MSEACTCSCCAGISPETPATIHNRPGLNAIAYRVGTYSQFRESLLAALTGPSVPALHKLTTRNNDDFSIALADAWAVASDVLTFYQERIANESYLRTATERFSILQLGRQIGYELRPGVAASTYLAFTLEDPSTVPILVPGSSGGAEAMAPVTILEPGIKVQSVPGPNEKPQTFETVEVLYARPEWNNIRPRLLRPQSTGPRNGFFILDDINVDIRKGDIVLIDAEHKPTLKRVVSVEVNKEAKTTTISFIDKPTLPSFAEKSPVPDGDMSKIPGGEKLLDAEVSKILDFTWKEEDLSVLVDLRKWSLKDLVRGIERQLHPGPSKDNVPYVFRKHASPFGYNAAKQVTYHGRVPDPPSEWKEWNLSEVCNIIHLDNEYKEIVPGGYVSVIKPGETLEKASTYEIKSVRTASRSAYGLNSKATSLTIEPTGCWYNDSRTKLSAIRSIALFVVNEPLQLADLPIEDVVQGDLMTLDRWYPGLKKGQKIIITGERTDLKGTIASEVMELNAVFVVKGYTVIRLTQSLQFKYVRRTVGLNANVVLATHGETVTEVLGSGDANMPFQRFVLRQPPLTYTSSSSVTGTDTTLKVYVNDVLWHEVVTFYGRAAEERIYITRQDNEGRTTIIFGNGITGARLPSGVENIKAIYRKGIGTGGLLKANQLSQLMTRPLGVKAALNPLPAKGADDAERLEEARRNAPLTLLTLGRIVSLQDYEDFARAFPGIEKALATWTWKNQRRYIFLTVAGVNGASVLKSDTLYKNLLKAIADSGDARIPVVVDSYKPRYFRITANVKVDADYIPGKVLKDVEQRLRTAFSFDARSFGQSVSLSEVITVFQQVKGVVATDIDQLYFAGGATGSAPSSLLTASIPVMNGGNIRAAELLTLDSAPPDLRIMS